MKVDNTTTVAFNDKRNTVRIASQDRFGVGSIWTADMYHVPYGVRHISPFLISLANRLRSAPYGLHGGPKPPTGLAVVKSIHSRA